MLSNNLEPSTKLTILLVEDDEDAQLLGRLHLQTVYNVSVAGSVSEATDVLKRMLVNLILLDLSLGGKEDGLDLVRYLRVSKKWKNLPVIALTAHAFKSDQENCLKAGCNDFITKPTTKAILLSKISAVLKELN